MQNRQIEKKTFPSFYEEKNKSLAITLSLQHLQPPTLNNGCSTETNVGGSTMTKGTHTCPGHPRTGCARQVTCHLPHIAVVGGF